MQIKAHCNFVFLTFLQWILAVVQNFPQVILVRLTEDFWGGGKLNLQSHDVTFSYCIYPAGPWKSILAFDFPMTCFYLRTNVGAHERDRNRAGAEGKEIKRVLFYC